MVHEVGQGHGLPLPLGLLCQGSPGLVIVPQDLDHAIQVVVPDGAAQGTLIALSK